MIEAKNLYKSFKNEEVLKDFSISIEKGEIVAIIGQSGKGKSVFLKHLVGLMQPDSGSITFNGKDITYLKGQELVKHRQKFGYVFQNGALLDSMDVFDNIALPLREVLRLKEKEVKERVMKEIELVGLSHAVHKFPSELSGGMIRRVSLARELVTNPEVILFDEPTTGLDPIIAQAILKHIKRLHDKIGFTGLLVTHQIPQAFSIVQKVAMLYNGKIEQIDTPENMMQSANPIVKQFIYGDLSGPIKENYF